MSRAKENWIRWWKFNAVGAMGIVVQLVTLTLLKSGLHLNYLLATALAVEATVIHNFFWHERYTWADRESTSRLIRFAKFNLSNGAISILGNVLLMRVLVGEIGLNYFVANALSIAGCSLLNFMVSDRLVFTGQPQSVDYEGDSKPRWASTDPAASVPVRTQSGTPMPL